MTIDGILNSNFILANSISITYNVKESVAQKKESIARSISQTRNSCSLRPSVMVIIMVIATKYCNRKRV